MIVEAGLLFLTLAAIPTEAGRRNRVVVFGTTVGPDYVRPAGEREWG